MFPRLRFDFGLFIAIAALLLCAIALAAPPEHKRPEQRARPPKWSPDVRNAFFDDARETLVGTRPDYEKATLAASADQKAEAAGQRPVSTGAAWSKLIDAETLEAEIKRLARAIGKEVTTPSAFKGGGYKDCRRDFSALALMFAITAEYDGSPRWQDVAPPMRDAFSRAGYNCKAGSDQTFQEAKQRKQDLTDLVAGNRPKLPNAERTVDWAKVADRQPLMQRLNVAHEERLKKWLADERQFSARGDVIRHEAQIIAVIADVISREGFEFADDEQYEQYAHELRQAGTDIASAVEMKNFPQARQAIDRATNACTNCHEGYRG